ncbi:MAG: hypothetical protein AAF604_24050 [Acidobacteriota bacterium]
MLKKLLPKLVLLTSAALLLSLPILATPTADSGVSSTDRAESRIEREQPLDVLESIEVIWDWVRSSIIGKKGAPKDSPGSGIDPNGGQADKPEH